MVIFHGYVSLPEGRSCSSVDLGYFDEFPLQASLVLIFGPEPCAIAKKKLGKYWSSNTPSNGVGMFKPYLYCLVVEPYPSEKYDFVSWDYDSPNIIGK